MAYTRRTTEATGSYVAGIIDAINHAAERFQNTQCSDARAVIVFASIAAAVVLTQAFGWWLA